MTQLIEDKIKEVQEKLALLIKQNTVIAKENDFLKKALKEAKQSAESAAKNAEGLQHQLDARKYSQALMEPEEKKAFEKKINTYIKEIDKCIAILSI